MELIEIIEAAQALFPSATGDRVGVRGFGGTRWIVTLFGDDSEVIGRAEVDAHGAAQVYEPPQEPSLTGSI